MERFNSWVRVVLTWVVIIPNLLISYLYLRFPSFNLEMSSLGLNFVCTTVLFYVYMDIYKSSAIEQSTEEIRNAKPGEESVPTIYKLTFGSLIEDMSVWLGLFFLLYNIVPVSLYVHNLIAKNLNY